MRPSIPLVLSALALCACQEPAPPPAGPSAGSGVAANHGRSHAPAAEIPASGTFRSSEGPRAGGQASSVGTDAEIGSTQARLRADGEAAVAPAPPGASLPSLDEGVPRTPAGAQSDLVRLRAVALAAVPGEVLEVDIDEDDVPVTYEFKILTPQGRVIELELDARSGRILEQEAE